MKFKYPKQKNTVAQQSIDKTIALTTGIVGLGMAQSVAGGLTGTPGMIVGQGVLPVGGLGLFGEAAKPYKVKKR